jgi:hypothetical protein
VVAVAVVAREDNAEEDAEEDGVEEVVLAAA